MLESLRSRLLAMFLLPSLALFGVSGGLGYLLTRNVLEDELGRALANIAASAASQLNGERLLSIQREDDLGEGTRTWRNVMRLLDEVKQATGSRRIFAFDRSGTLRADSGGGLPVGEPVPELERDRLELTRVFDEGRSASSQVLFEGKDGRLYKTGYAPVFADGKVVAAVGVEGSAEFFGPLRSLFRAYAVLVAAGLLLLAALAVLTARGLSGPLQRLMDSALRIGRGDLSTPVRPEPTREIGVLSRELEAMRRALESRDRQLKMMLAGVAHEVRNPLGGIELFAGLLAEELSASEGEARSHVERIRREIDYLKRIVEDFLAFAREQTLAMTELDGRTLLESARDLLKADADAKGVPLEVEAESATVEGDQNLLLAAVVNLVKNAVQASPSHAPVGLRGRKTGDRYVLEIADRGGGIPPDSREKIFEPFYTTREKGTGLGLPLAKKIIQAHRGEISVRSRPGETVFTVELPLARPGEREG